MRNMLLAAVALTLGLSGPAAAQTIELGFALHTSPPGRSSPPSTASRSS